MTNSASTRKQTDIVDNRRWLAYATAGAAGALVCQASEASIIYVSVNQVLDFSGGPGTSAGSAFFALGAASSASLAFAHQGNTSLGSAIVGVFGAVSGAFAGFSTAGFPYAFNLAPGQNVSTVGGFLSGTGTMAFASGYGNSEFLSPGIGYVGFQFDGGLGTQFGWARVDMSGAPFNSFEIVDYAFTTEGQSIAVGQSSEQPVPEPNALGLLAAGAAGLALARRRKRRAATA